jgi:hypothetical protein
MIKKTGGWYGKEKNSNISVQKYQGYQLRWWLFKVF